MRISDWSSDVCASDLLELLREAGSQLLIRLALLAAHRHVPELLLIRRQDTADVSQLQEDGVWQDAPQHALGAEARGLDRSDRDLAALGRLVRRTVQPPGFGRSAENTSELQSLMRISYAVFCLK